MNKEFIRNFHHYDKVKVNHADDILRSINDSLGFGVKAGDVIEVTKVINLYDGKGAGKVVVPPTHLQVDHVTDKFIYFTGLVTKDGLTPTYKGWYTYNNEDTYIIIPMTIKKVLDTGDKTVAAVKEVGSGFGDILGNLFSGLKWVLIAVVVIGVISIALRLAGK